MANLVTQDPNSNDLADTFQWDTVFAIKIKDANEAIKAKSSSPANMSYQMDGDTKVDCTFGNWSIDSTGDGRLIHMNIPITNSKITFDEKSLAINNIKCIAEVQMHFYDTAPPDPKSSGTFHDLKVKSHKNDLNEKLVTGVTMDFGTQTVSPLAQGLLSQAIDNWLNENIQIFDHIFATVNLNKIIADGSYQWLMPTKIDYAFINNATNPEDSTLGVLCMTEKRDSDHLITELSHNAIHPNSSSGFLISQSRLIYKMILPSIPNAFKGLEIEDFTVSDDGKSINLKSLDKSFSIQHDGKTYDANIEAFTLSLEGKQLTLHAETKTTITPGIYAHTASDHTYELSLYNKPDGTQSIKYNEVGTPVVNQWTSQDEGVVVGEIIAGIIAAIIVGILIVLTDGLILIAVIIIGGLLVGLISNISNIIKLVGTSDAPDISMLIFNCTDPIKWTGTDHFNLNYVALNGPLQLGGIFKP
jgi:hypothetical protein